MTLTYRLSALTLASLGAISLSACQDEPSRVPQDFISDDPTAGGEDSNAGEDGEAADTSDPSTGDEGGAEGEDGGGDEVDISEADIVQVEGDRLYALSAYAGLSVVDMSNPDALRSLGTWETDAEPFEMYVEAGQAFVMFNDYWSWSFDEGLDEWSYYSTSRLVALDASDPSDITVRGEFSLPGRIQDSRRVGDVLYLVTMEDGWCWGCDGEQKTVVTSLDISNQASPVIVEQREFPAIDDTWDWQRSVESTTDRMYIAANQWVWEGAGSVIDVVDISAHDGTLVPGAQVQVTGSISSRWQMSEHEGVLRVVSQLGWEDDPLIETFTIESSQSFVPLGTGNLAIPMPESLRSVRFDGDRAFAITAEQTDPLFTIDLSDPANPQQVGELEIPGWVYHMEVRDDRVLALGFDNQNPEGSINVSLFDVSALDNPTLRRRVHFGGDWASFAEDQNRIHKAFTILEDEQMLLVPHQGWSHTEGESEFCSGQYRSGVQIIDWKDDDLTLRGLVPARGRPRRAFTHRERIMAVSDSQLASFEYSDRDAPVADDELALAVQVDDLVKAGDVWVRMARDWYTTSQVLEIVGDDPTNPEPLGVIDLGATDSCEWTWIEDVFAVGDHVYVIRSSERWDEGSEYYYSWTSELLAVDVSNPAAPVLADSFEIPGQRGWGYGNIGNISTNASWLAQQGDHVVVLTEDEDGANPQVHVLDVSDPGNIALAATLARPEGHSQGELSVMSDTVVSWHTEPVEGQPGKVRFYFDRLELDGTPSWASSINVPGVIVAYDAAAGRAFTVDFELSSVDLPSEECWNHPKHWDFQWSDENYDVGTCILVERTLEHLEIDGDHAYLIESIDIEGEYGSDQLYATDERLFIKLDASSYDYTDDSYVYEPDTRLVVVDVGSPSAERSSIDGEQFGDWWWMNEAEGTRAVMQQGYGGIGLVDATDIDAVDVSTSSLPAWGGCYNPIIDGDRVWCPMGAYGLEQVEW